MPTKDQIQHAADEAGAIVADGEDGYFSPMTYEEGVAAALQWVAGETDTHPLEEHPSYRA